jgi:small subunit ribosomal protein S17
MSATENGSTPEAVRPKRRNVIGVVTSSRMNKSIVVQVDRKVLHPRFKKYIRRSTRYMAHDEKNEAGVGDKVLIVETRPLSKRKSFRLVEILERAKLPDLLAAPGGQESSS